MIPTQVHTERRARTIVLLLAASVGLMMTGYGIVMPVFARRLDELGAGVAALGFMTMAFAFAQFALAPFMGNLADRFGRRPLVLLALAGVVATNIAYLLTASVESYIVTRFLQGALSAGLLPASIAVVADIFPEDRRGRWAGLLMGSYGAGFIFGPALGGALYDWLGFVAPFGVSAGLALLGLLLAAVLVPETRPPLTQSEVPKDRPARVLCPTLASVPRPMHLFFALLALDFTVFFGFAFIEPEMVFYFYDGLGFSTTQFGVLVGGYGLAMVAGQTTLGGLSDRFGRRLVIAVGFALNAVFYLGLTSFDRFGLLLLLALSAGLGNALATPALSASYLDITEERYRSSVLGIKESATALGGVAGPLLVAFVSPFTTPGGVFAVSGIVALGAILLSLIALRGVRPSERIAELAEVREELPRAATTLHCLTCAADAASDAVPAGTAAVAVIDKHITVPTKKEEPS
jgi:DHA1 family tetracycline resistance protein-like MFS transporter